MIVHINSTVVWLWCLHLTIIQQVWVVYEQIVNEAQPSWLIVLAQQNGRFVILHLLFYTKYLQDVPSSTLYWRAVKQLSIVADGGQTSPDTALIVVIPRPKCLVQKPCEIILYIIIMNVSNFRKSEVTTLSVVTRKVLMSVEHCHKNIERLLPVAIFSKYYI